MDDPANISVTAGASTPAEQRKRKYDYSGRFTRETRRAIAERAEVVKDAKLTQGVVYGRDGLTTLARRAVLHAIFDPFPQDFNTRLLDRSHAERLARMDYSPTMLRALGDETTVAVIKGWLSRFDLELTAK